MIKISRMSREAQKLFADGFKKCASCHTDKGLEHYDIDKRSIDGLQPSCKKCARDRNNERRYKLGTRHPLYSVKNCPLYFGVFVEDLLSEYFNQFTRMPMHNPGYDYICGRGLKIDVKGSCRRKYNDNRSDRWQFDIAYNKLADYFLCVGFDDRTSLNVEHVWLIPVGLANTKSVISISSQLTSKGFLKWVPYERPINSLVEKRKVAP